MKKELLLATTVAGIALGATSASAVTASMSGNHRVGIEDEDKDSNTAGTGTTNENRKSSFSVSLSETLDSGTTIAGAFSLMSESGKKLHQRRPQILFLSLSITIPYTY